MDKDEVVMLAHRLRNAIDASERVKIAADLGEYGTPDVAPLVLEAIWEDEKSNVREIAVHSFTEIMQEDALPELKKMVKEHPDQNVRFYAVFRAGDFTTDEAKQIVKLALDDPDKRVKAIAYKRAVDLEMKELESRFAQELLSVHPASIIRNILVGLALWRTEVDFTSFLEGDNLEFKTLAHLAMARRGDKESLKFLEQGEIDNSIRIKYKNEMFRKREGMLKLANYAE